MVDEFPNQDTLSTNIKIPMDTVQTLNEKIDRPFIIERDKVEASIDMPYVHYHEHYEIYYLLKGERNYFIKDSMYHVFPGDVVVINRREFHRTLTTGYPKYERIVINFKKSFLEDLPLEISHTDIFTLFEKRRILHTSLPVQEHIERLLLTMIQEQSAYRPGFALYLRYLLAELLIILFRCHTETPKQSTDPQLSPPQQKIFEIVKYINENYAQPLTLTTVANTFAISYYYLSHSFKTIMGLSFVEYLNKIRIKEAQDLLKNTNQSITVISELVGYDSITHFERNFKQLTGLTPHLFKKWNVQ